MARQSQAYRIPTSHGTIAVRDTGSGARSAFLIHGNSSSAEVFRHQFDSPLLAPWRLVAVDLPGHGASTNAVNPERTYTRPGFADALVEVLARLELPDPVLVGWSLGGHIALEMAPRLLSLRGMMVCGAPPVGNTMAEGFRAGSGVRYGAREHLADEDLEAFGRAVFGAALDAPLRAALARADGRARRLMFEAAHAGAGINQRHVAEHLVKPLAVVNGADDALVNLDYFDRIAYRNLWSGHCHRLPGAGHAPFLETPDAFNALLARFLADLEAPVRGRRRPDQLPLQP